MSVARIQSFISKTGTTTVSLLSKGAAFSEVHFNSLMQKNAKYVVQDPAAESLLLRQWIFTKLSKLPGIVKGASKEYQEVGKLWANRSDFTVKDVGIGAFFCAELFAWFSVGEIIGRGGTITGYYF
eukprot:g8868.t1